MEAVGIIAEYNPFHNGHLYHLEKVKEMFPDKVVVLILSGNFTQRGDVSILNKWQKTEIALEASVDLVVELPFPFAVSSSDIFAYGAITLLDSLLVTDFVFGSETCDIDGMKILVEVEKNNDELDNLVQVYLRMGNNYPTSLSLALKDITGKTYQLPNDILGISYLKALDKIGSKVKPSVIKRINSYHDEELSGEISSATSIRKALKDKVDISNTVPSYSLKYLNDDISLNNYFPFIKYKILTSSDLTIYPFIDSGLAKKLKKEVINVKSVDELIKKVKSRNTTYSKISRSLVYLLVEYTKEKKLAMKDVKYIRLLGFSSLGKKYLNEHKKEFKLPLISKFTREKDLMLSFELETSLIYALPFKNQEELVKKEYQTSPIIRKE